MTWKLSLYAILSDNKNKQQKNLLLFLGLFISLISIGFNVFVFGYHNELISDKEEELAFISFSNLYLSAEYNHSENMYFKSRELEYLLKNLRAANDNLSDTNLINMIQEDLGRTRIKAVNYALNSSIDLVNTKYDPNETNEIIRYINDFDSQKRLDHNSLDTLKSRYVDYYKRHERYIKKNMDDKIQLTIEISKLKRKNGWMKFMAISFQTIGLILVFLKDYKN